MTEQELNEKEAKNIDRVISSLKSILAFYKSKATPRRPLKSIRWALVVAIELCEKQIAKKPNIEGDGYADGYLVYDTWICPNCEKDYEIDYDDYDYCPNCGQKIDKSVFDWGNEDAE